MRRTTLKALSILHLFPELRHYNNWIFFPHDATAPSGPRPPHYQGFTITHSVRLPCTIDQPDAGTSTWKKTALKRNKSPCPPAGFKPAIPSSEDPQTHTLDRVATWHRQSKRIGPWNRLHDDVLPGPYSMAILPFACLSILHASAVLTAMLHKLITARSRLLTLILLTSTIWRAPTNASKWRMGFNSAFKGLIQWLLKYWKWSLPRLRYSTLWRRVVW